MQEYRSTAPFENEAPIADLSAIAGKLREALDDVSVLRREVAVLKLRLTRAPRSVEQQLGTWSDRAADPYTKQPSNLDTNFDWAAWERTTKSRIRGHSSGQVSDTDTATANPMTV